MRTDEGINHWDPHSRSAWVRASIARVKKATPRRASFFDGLDVNISYFTIKSLARLAGVKEKVVRYALSKEYLKASRRQPGRAGVLIHPTEGNRWIAERKSKEKLRA